MNKDGFDLVGVARFPPLCFRNEPLKLPFSRNLLAVFQQRYRPHQAVGAGDFERPGTAGMRSCSGDCAVQPLPLLHHWMGQAVQ